MGLDPLPSFPEPKFPVNGGGITPLCLDDWNAKVLLMLAPCEETDATVSNRPVKRYRKLLDPALYQEIFEGAVQG